MALLHSTGSLGPIDFPKELVEMWFTGPGPGSDSASPGWGSGSDNFPADADGAEAEVSLGGPQL